MLHNSLHCNFARHAHPKHANRAPSPNLDGPFPSESCCAALCPASALEPCFYLTNDPMALMVQSQIPAASVGPWHRADNNPNASPFFPEKPIIWTTSEQLRT